MSYTKIVEELPNCDVCEQKDKIVKARFDICPRERGPWFYMCLQHFYSHRVRIGNGLGTGMGCLLVLDKEDPQTVAKDLGVKL